VGLIQCLVVFHC